MFPILRHPDLPQSFVATVAALCNEAARRKATYVEIHFYDDVTVRDDGEAYGERAQWWIRQIGIDEDAVVDDGSKWPLGIYAGLRHTRHVSVSTWPALGESRLADTLTFDRMSALRPNWGRTLIPPATNSPPAHGVAVAWKNLDAGAQLPELFDRLKAQLREQLTEPVANMIRLRIPALHGFRSLS
ncbi:hypothetical protein EBS80_04835 [bacterium]|nr:hypothetical protein [bacterium]